MSAAPRSRFLDSCSARATRSVDGSTVQDGSLEPREEGWLHQGSSAVRREADFSPPSEPKEVQSTGEGQRTLACRARAPAATGGRASTEAPPSAALPRGDSWGPSPRDGCYASCRAPSEPGRGDRWLRWLARRDQAVLRQTGAGLGGGIRGLRASRCPLAGPLGRARRGLHDDASAATHERCAAQPRHRVRGAHEPKPHALSRSDRPRAARPSFGTDRPALSLGRRRRA